MNNADYQCSGGSRGGGGGGPAPHPFFELNKKKSRKEERLTGQAKQPHHPLTQGLDPPLTIWQHCFTLSFISAR